MCQAVKPHPCSTCVSLSLQVFGCEREALSCLEREEVLYFGISKRSSMALQPFALVKTTMVGGQFGGCVAANLPHMEATAFPMCFPLLMMMSLSMLFHLSSLPIPFCPSRAENELIDTRGGTRPSSFYPSLFLSFNILRLAVFDLFFLTVCANPIQSASYSDPQIKSLMTSAKISHKIQAKFPQKS